MSDKVYRGKVSDGVVVLEGKPLSDGTIVQVIPLEQAETPSLATHPAVGIWKDRADLAEDASEVKRQLGRKLMGQLDE